MFKLVLVTPGPSLGPAWQKYFAEQEHVSMVRGDIFQISCDAMVSPANSFGFMDGGLDLAISERFGWGLQERLQQVIREKHAGELLVGQAEIIETHDARVPWLISAPTMRVPMRIRESINAYLAMRAVLRAVLGHDRQPAIRTVAVPGLGTGVGSLAAETAALQMWTAYEEVVLGRYLYPADIGVAADQHLRLNPLGRLFD